MTPSRDTRVNLRDHPVSRLAAALLIAFVGLYVYSLGKIDAEQFALGVDTITVKDSRGGQRVNASTIAEIRTFTEAVQSGAIKRLPYVLWLGNSQLHAINQYSAGEHLGPYWLAELGTCKGCSDIIGVSLASANLQEQFVLASSFHEKVPVSLVIVKLVFQNWREDGLRSEFEPVLTPALRSTLEATDAGRSVLQQWDDTKKATSGGTESAGLHGFVQQRLEDFLVDRLGQVIPLWADRTDMRNRLHTDLWHVRNAMLGIKPGTVRKAIRPRYLRNLQALDGILADFGKAGIPAITYIAPIRHDIAMPYDPSEYAAWKAEISAMAERYKIRHLDLDRVVPAELWGTYTSGTRAEVDYMHFRGAGPRILAERLVPEVESLLTATPAANSKK